MSAPLPAIGGYFELELARGESEFHRRARRYQSARAALLALLRAGRPAALWLPWYICDCMLEPPAMANIPVRRYALDESLRVVDAQPDADDWLLYVNYFGICGRNVAETLRRFDPARVIVDNCQAFFDAPANCLATLYSPRKFLGVPDGGYLYSRLEAPEPDETDDGSFARCAHLLKRLGGNPEAGYADFVAADASLAGQEPKRMSRLTQTLLSRLPYSDIQARRAANFAWLHERLSEDNDFPLDPQGDEAPLCYPYRSRDACAPETLHAQRIYVPRYWRSVAESKNVPAFESALARDTLFLPCDQRMTTAQLERLLDVLLARTGRMNALRCMA